MVVECYINSLPPEQLDIMINSLRRLVRGILALAGIVKLNVATRWPLLKGIAFRSLDYCFHKCSLTL